MPTTRSEAKKPTQKQIKQVAGYMRAIAVAFKAYLVKNLSKPVSIIRRRSPQTGRWGTHVVRSNPGEYPRAETGSLANTVSYTVEPRGNNVHVSIGWLGDRSQKRFMSKTRNFPVGHPAAPRGGRKFKLTKTGRATGKSPKTPDFYSYILEYRMRRKLLQRAWRDFVTSGMLRRAVQGAGFQYVAGSNNMHILNFGVDGPAKGYKTWAGREMNFQKNEGVSQISMPREQRRRWNLHSREKWMENVENDKQFGPGYIGGAPRAEDY